MSVGLLGRQDGVHTGLAFIKRGREGVCVYRYVYIYMSICIYIHVYIYKYMYIHIIYTQKRTFVCVHIYKYMYMHIIYTQKRTFVCVHICICCEIVFSMMYAFGPFGQQVSLEAAAHPTEASTSYLSYSQDSLYKAQ